MKKLTCIFWSLLYHSHKQNNKQTSSQHEIMTQCEHPTRAEKWCKDEDLWAFTYLGFVNDTYNFMCEVCKEVKRGQKIHLQLHVRREKHIKNLENIVRKKVEKRRARRE